MNKIKATCIKNPFQPRNPENRDEREFEFKGQTIGDVFCEYYPIPDPSIKIVASVNGKVYEQADWKMELADGDHLVFVPVPQGGGGGGGSNVMMVVAMVVVAAVAWYAGGAAFSAMYGAASASGAGVSTAAWGAMQVAGALVTAGIMVGGGLLVSSMFPTTTPGIDKGELSETSPTYSWSGYNNAVAEGSILPIMIGERRVAPPLIAAHSENVNGKSYLYLLYAVSEGQLESIYDIEINNQPISYYSNVGIMTRYGDDDQEVIPYFNDIYSDTSVNTLLNKSSYVLRETSGTGIDAAQIHLSLPMGLWYANDKGGMDSQEMSLSIQYKKVNDIGWTTYFPTEDNDGVEIYKEGKIYNVSQLVLYNGIYYKCTHYYATKRVKTYYAGSNWTYVYTDGFYESLNPAFYVHKAFAPLVEKNVVFFAKSTPPPPNSECWTPYAAPTASLIIKSNSNSAINRSYRINFPETGQYQIQVKVVSGPPEGNSRYGSKAVWAGLTEIINDDITYPGVSLLGLRILATDQLSGGIPTVTCIAKKTTHTLPVAGTIDLTNPAWANYYVLNNAVWGGAVSESKIALSDFQSWASYCSGKEIKGSVYVDQRMTYNDLKNYFCEFGRGQVIQLGTKFACVVDKPDTATQLFTVGNILKDSFKMDYLPIDDRANVIRVNYYDRDQNWEKATVEVRTNEFITGNKEKAQEITLYPCDDKALAGKHGRLLLNYNKNLVRTVSFDVAIDALACVVGDIIKVQHDATRYGFGGRIVSISGTSVVLDRKIALTAGVTYGMLARNNENDIMETRTFSVDVSGEYDSITLDSAYTVSIAKDDVYSIGEYTLETKPFRIIAITRSEEFTRKITAIEYLESVYDDTQIVEDELVYALPPIVTGLVANEVIDNVFSKFTMARLSWNCPGSRGVNINYWFESEDSGDIIEKFVGNYKSSSIEINNLPVGIPITFTVTPIGNPFGEESVVYTLWAEDNAIYDNGCYEYDVFANPSLQEKAGFKEPYSMWMQEPQTVTLSFLD